MKRNIIRLLTLPERTRNFILFIVFHFDRWHISPSGNRIYPKAIINFVRKIYPIDSICEIGCGLGDIISKLDGKYMLGFDYEVNVLKAASFLHKSIPNLEFKKFIFPDSELNGQFDLIIAVNWIHGVDEEIVKNSFLKYYKKNLNNNGYMIVDSLNQKGYKYYHDFKCYFQDLNCEIIEIGQFPGGRKVLAIKKMTQ